MKADAITPCNCKLAPGSLQTISIDLADGRVVITTGVQHDYVIMTSDAMTAVLSARRLSRLRKYAGSDRDLNLSVVSRYPALSVMLGPTN